MAKIKGLQMIKELVKRRAGGDGLRTIATGLKVSKNTVKSRLRAVLPQKSS